MAKKARKYSVDFKQEAVRRMAGATTIVGLAKKLGIRRKLLYQWRDQLQAEGRAGLGATQGPAAREQVASAYLRQYPVRRSCGSLSWSGC